LEESYADIFAILIVNRNSENIDSWIWTIGDGFGMQGGPLRNLQDPSTCGQPNHYENYYELPENRDHGGIHTNSGIHNQAAYFMLTYKDEHGHYIFNSESAKNLFYRALLNLKSNANFVQSRLALIKAAHIVFNSDENETVLQAIGYAFDRVGVTTPDDRLGEHYSL
jgi:Zn-dependent metalloprotease